MMDTSIQSRTKMWTMFDLECSAFCYARFDTEQREPPFLKGKPGVGFDPATR
jgi:hypothetical protein